MGCQSFSLGKACQIAPCCHPVKGFASGLRPPLTGCHQCAERVVKEGQINLPSRANAHSSSEVHSMLFHRSKHAEVPLEPFGIVVPNKIFNHSDQACSVGEVFSIIPFSLQDSPESLHRPVINASGNSGHTLSHTGFGQHTVESSIGILVTPVTMKQRMRIWICGNCCLECIKDQWIIIRIPDYITDNPPII